MQIYTFFKRLIDIIITIPALIVLFPSILVIGVLILLADNGPVLFKQTRAGKNGKPFELYKFRTMKTSVDPFGASPKTENDERLTKVGKFLREYSLDELPQFFNILKGNMALVGPRPLYLSQMKEWNQKQKKRLLVKPGLTGLAQISGRGQLTIEKKLELDVRYVESSGFLTDVRILFATFLHLFTKKNVYEGSYSEKEHTRGDSQTEQEDKT